MSDEKTQKGSDFEEGSDFDEKMKEGSPFSQLSTRGKHTFDYNKQRQ